MNQDSDELLFARGDAYEKNGDLDEAKRDYLKAMDDVAIAISFQVDNADYYWHGRTYTYLNEYFQVEDAISDFTEAIEIDRDNADYYWWRGKIYYESEQYQNSIDDYNSTVKQKPDNGGYYYWKTKMYGKLGDIDRKKEVICKAIECNTAYPSYHYYLGVLYYNEDDYDNVIAEFKVSVDNAPDDA